MDIQPFRHRKWQGGSSGWGEGFRKRLVMPRSVSGVLLGIPGRQKENAAGMIEAAVRE